MAAVLAVHADPDAIILEKACKGFAGELDALIRIEALRCTMALQPDSQGGQAALGGGLFRSTRPEEFLRG